MTTQNKQEIEVEDMKQNLHKPKESEVEVVGVEEKHDLVLQCKTKLNNTEDDAEDTETIDHQKSSTRANYAY